MNKVKAEGQINHGFFGTYVATLILLFSDKESASDALKTLSKTSEQWKVGKTHPECLVWSGGGDEFEALKEELDQKHHRTNFLCGRRDCKHQCKNVDIDGCNHSIDYGPKFTVEIDTVSEEQRSLF